MAKFKLEGFVHRIGQTQQVSDKFMKRELVLLDESDEKYPQTLSIEFVQDKTALLDNVLEGQTVEVSFNLRGREWTNPSGETKVFNTLNGFRIDVIGGVQKQKESAVAQDDDSSLPF
jgi:hypothetical protein